MQINIIGLLIMVFSVDLEKERSLKFDSVTCNTAI